MSHRKWFESQSKCLQAGIRLEPLLYEQLAFVRVDVSDRKETYGDVYGVTEVPEKNSVRITINVHNCEDMRCVIATMFHELGHAIDLVRRPKEYRGYHNGPWKSVIRDVIGLLGFDSVMLDYIAQHGNNQKSWSDLNK